MTAAFGIDIGGSGIKGARVDIDAGRLLSERQRLPTPQPATPESVSEVIARIVHENGWNGPVGCTFPAVVQDGVVHNATNMDPSWTGVNARESVSSRLDQRVQMLNDADAAGIAELRFGAGQPYQDHGVVLMLTFGTGIGSAIFVDGHLLPNSELGDLEIDGQRAETVAAGTLRESNKLSWQEWTTRVQRYLGHVELLLQPDVIICGGGISEHSHLFLPQLRTRATLVAAELRNDAGIVGAAYAAHQVFGASY